MIVDPTRVHDYFQKYDDFERRFSRGLGRTTAYLSLLRDHIESNRFLGGKYAFISQTAPASEHARIQFLDMLYEWEYTPSRVQRDRIVVDTHSVYFMYKSYQSCAMTGLKFDAIFADAYVEPDALIFHVTTTGKIYGYE